jgi:hypothetical protein
VPYALKAEDAQTLGGLPASAFVQASPSIKAGVEKAGVEPSDANSLQSSAVTAATITGTGKASYIPLWTSATNLGASLLFQTGSQVGINTTTPTATLDVKGSGIFASSSGSEALQVTQTGTGSGIVASTNAAEGYGVTGTASSTTSSGIGGVGVYGVSLNPLGYGVLGVNSSVGVYGYNPNLAATGIGVQGQGNQYGVYGFTAANPVATTQAGVYGSTGSTSATAYGVEGNATATTGTPIGVFGNSSSSSGYGVYGNSPNVGLFGNGTGTGGIGVDGHGAFIGVKGVATASGGLSGYFGGGPLEVAGNGNNALFGDPGCGSGFSGFSLSSGSLSGCNNYTLIGKSSGDVYLNSTSTGSIHFRNRNTGGNSNSDLATIDNAGDLTVAGKVHNGNVAASVTFSNEVGASVGDCVTPIVPNPNCVTPGMSVTVTTSGGPVLIMADIGGIAGTTGGSACQAALFYIVMDKQVVSQHEVLLPNVGVLAVANVTMVSLQTPTAGTHTFQIQETDDASSCGSGDYSPTIVSFLWGAPWGAATRTLIVREL